MALDSVKSGVRITILVGIVDRLMGPCCLPSPRIRRILQFLQSTPSSKGMRGSSSVVLSWLEPVAASPHQVKASDFYFLNAK